ncbi:cyclin-D5-1 isoform X2 [Gossypium hirsutum]|uniref:Cyclin-D5-1 isoform X2 n=1 Tax=Gossypium hirsutum TaxID=3635 RepID=A0ABM3A5I3_GOSHI|nr:cyclin-D5-1 isoform X2 [Gossypium hirsutum]
MICKMEVDASSCSLLCLENETFLKEKEESTDENYIAEYDEECVQMLFDREMSFGFKKSEPLVLCNYLKYARSEAITWILKTRAAFGFRCQTAYLSMIYFDRFLSIKSIATEEFNFESKTIQRMELLVLNTLEWRLSSATPFAFLNFFIKKMCKISPPDHFISITVQLIFLTIKEINLMEHRPSVVAVAAILRTLNKKLTRKALECTMNSLSCEFLEIEDVFRCYNLMQKLDTSDELNIPKSENATHSSAIDAVDDCSSSGTVCAKRKRLAFNKNVSNSDQVTNEKRLSAGKMP